MPCSFLRGAGTVLLLIAALACGSGNSTTPITPTTTLPAGPTPTPPPVAAGCPLGFGSGKFRCQGDIPGLLPQLDAAINKLIAERPQLFNLNDPPAAGAYQIYDVDAFYAGVIANLTAAGLCGEVSMPFRESLWIKENNSYSENYDIVTAQSVIRRGPKSYLGTCTPANFPLTAETAVARVSVSIFRIANCPPGTTIPLLGLNQLPVGCVGTITATPRDAVGNKLPLDLHGTDVKWFFQAGEGYVVSASPDEETVFNLRLGARNPGEFSICATVHDKTGCMSGTVIE